MQTIYKDKDKRNDSRRVDSIDLVIYTRWIYRCLKRKHIRRSEGEVVEI